MTTSLKNHPSCFGELDTVFPKAEHGLRTTPRDCLRCPFKTDCLKAAMAGIKGLKVREEFVDRAYTAGHITFLERWSRKKTIEHRLKDRIKDQTKDKKRSAKGSSA